MTSVLIVEGAELTGKSYVISQVYEYIEQRYNTDPRFLNGCHWFNCDVGIFGGSYGRLCIEKYVELAEALRDRHLIFEKFHITDAAYHQLYKHSIMNYADIEKRLTLVGAKVLFCSIEASEELFARRLSDRIGLYPHYRRIAKEPREYIQQQQEYQSLIQQSTLPVLTVDTTTLPNPEAVKKIIDWLG